MKPLKLTASIAVGLVVGLLVACGDTSNADSGGPTMAQFNALKAQVAALSDKVSALQDSQAALEQRVEALEGESHESAADNLYLALGAPNLTASVRSAHARALYMRAPSEGTASNPCEGLGTIMGSPINADIMSSKVYAAASCTGYLYDITAATEGESSHVIGALPRQSDTQPWPTRKMLYTGSDCTGDVYWELPSAPAIANGAVLTFPRGKGKIDPNDPSQYWYLPAGEASESATFLSQSYVAYYGASCFTFTDSPYGNPQTSSAYRLKPNNPSVTGVDSAPIPGPIVPIKPGTGS